MPSSPQAQTDSPQPCRHESERHDSELRSTGAPSTGRRMSVGVAIARSAALVGIASMAAYTSTRSSNPGAGIAAWVAVAVVGASSVISAAKHNRR